MGLTDKDLEKFRQKKLWILDGGGIIMQDEDEDHPKWEWPVWILRGLTNKIDTEDGSWFRFSRGLIYRSQLECRGVDIRDENNIEIISARMSEFSQSRGHVIPLKWLDIVLPLTGGKKRLAVFSNNCRANIMFALGSHAARFEAFQTWENTPRTKPAPDGVLLICKKLGIKPSDVLVVDNNDYGESSAKQAGADSVIAVDGEDLADVAKIFEEW